jgi:soluble lytic murein transglycosylase
LRAGRSVLFLAFLAVCLAVAAPRAQALSSEDRQIYRAAFAAAKGTDSPGALRLAAHARDPLLRKVLTWMALSRGASGASFADIAAFIAQNPDWPGQLTLRQRAEEAIAGASDAAVREWFGRFHPVTPYGKLRQAELMMADGQKAAAAAQIRDVWINSELSAFDEKSILARFPGIIRGEDHIKRLDRVLWDGLDESAKRMLPRVPQDYRLLADARTKLADFKPGVEGALAKVPAHLRNDPGLLYERTRWRRRKELYDAATESLLSAPKDLIRPIEWWTERQILARHALTDGNPQLAYRLVGRHELTEGTAAFADAEFLAGWIALRSLHNAQAGYDHFVRLYNGVKLPISRARGAYWAGRAAEALNRPDLAATWFANAAEHATTYYGQLARAKVGGEAARQLNAEPKPTAEEIAQFRKRELVRAVEMMGEIGETDRLSIFMHKLSALATTPGEHVLVASLFESVGRLDLAVGAAKRAGYAGVMLINHGYPTIELPKGAPERPLVLAMTRQESAFERTAVSKSGARGLMQLMPATASHIAKSRQLPYSPDRLLTDGSYNLTLGRAYLEELLDRFSGSYVLSIAAYNAGPARVRQWIETFGDPRTRNVDVVDWVESIPFTETRNYVQRVLENLQVYRMRLGDHALAFSLASDLRR